MMIGLLSIDEGEIWFDGQNVAAFKHDEEFLPVRKRVAMVFQGAALFDSMTVFENVAFPVREKQRSVKVAELRRKVIEKLKVVDLGEEVLERFPSELSGGMRKRVGLARALVSDPEVVLYDEPTTGLDPITTDYVDSMILAAKNRLGVTSIVISHDIASAFRVADRLAVLYDGHLAAEGTPEEVRASPDPYVQHFLSMWFAKQ
jgi:phospholipid/cholesterol/gamma-HCH transport system ATP-binding protein